MGYDNIVPERPQQSPWKIMNEQPTLRDLFAIHAPSEPQSWFVPVILTERPTSYWESDDGKRQFASPFAAEKECGEDFHNPAEEMQDAWDAEYLYELHVQWPYAWADAQLQARGA